MIVLPSGLALLNTAIVRRAQRDIPIMENPFGSNRSPEIDELCKRFGVPLASYWCALWASAVWQDSGAEIPPVDNHKAWHPAIANTWLQWAIATRRFTHTPQIGCASLYGANGRGPAEHIGACVVALEPLIMDFEGNTSLAGFSRNGELTGLKQVDAARLIGYVNPEPMGIAIL